MKAGKALSDVSFNSEQKALFLKYIIRHSHFVLLTRYFRQSGNGVGGTGSGDTERRGPAGHLQTMAHIETPGVQRQKKTDESVAGGRCIHRLDPLRRGFKGAGFILVKRPPGPKRQNDRRIGEACQHRIGDLISPGSPRQPLPLCFIENEQIHILQRVIGYFRTKRCRIENHAHPLGRCQRHHIRQWR